MKTWVIYCKYDDEEGSTFGVDIYEGLMKTPFVGKEFRKWETFRGTILSNTLEDLANSILDEKEIILEKDDLLTVAHESTSLSSPYYRPLRSGEFSQLIGYLKREYPEFPTGRHSHN